MFPGAKISWKVPYKSLGIIFFHQFVCNCVHFITKVCSSSIRGALETNNDWNFISRKRNSLVFSKDNFKCTGTLNFLNEKFGKPTV